ncbi:hypothetical protein DL96DRAFT_1612328 [Flagelloscypha sp. PMI_526]|nr:hypothetical protein DL96DRAFT_1612328 [Flagelloscypha sp. PMI_526]
MQSGNNSNDGDSPPNHNHGPGQNGTPLPIMPFSTASQGDGGPGSSQRNSPHPPAVPPMFNIRQIAAASGQPLPTTVDHNIDPAISNYRHDPNATHYLPPGYASLFPGPPPSAGLPETAAVEAPDGEDDSNKPEDPTAVDGDWKPKPSRKPRREKPRIELAADQPPTTQGKPRARVYVACAQCRGRKIRCDGAKPVCHNCSRRPNGTQECQYDTQPKRRGPDKIPGARQRMAREREDGAPEDDYTGEGAPAPKRRRRRPVTEGIRAIQAQNAGLTDGMVAEFPQGAPGQIPPNVASMFPPGTDVQALLQQHQQQQHHQQQRPGDLPNGTSFVSDQVGFSREPASNPAIYPPPPGRHLDEYSLYTIDSTDDIDTESSLSSIEDEDYEDYASDDLVSSSASYTVVKAPSLDFSRKTWWDNILYFYHATSLSPSPVFSSSHRELAARNMILDMRFAFRVSNYWLSFVHIPSFFQSLINPSDRPYVQPSLILALLALSILWQSSEVGTLKHAGRKRAMQFRVEAQMALEQSLNSGWIDLQLAQAAWLIAWFEISCHPEHSTMRTTSSMRLLDSVIRSLHLNAIDQEDAPSLFPPWSPKAASVTTSTSSQIQEHTLATQGCSCASFTLASRWPSTKDHCPCWATTPAWDPACLTPADIQKESCRRLCWSVVLLAAGNMSYSTAGLVSSSPSSSPSTKTREGWVPDFYVGNPANFSLLFSGESLLRGAFPQQSKTTVWGLYDRIMLLWLGCIRMRYKHTAPSAPGVEKDVHAEETEKAEFAVKAWIEADYLEEQLNQHTCAIERSFIFQGREYLFNIRMSISYEFRNFIPIPQNNLNTLFNRPKAEEWLHHQRTVAERFMYGLAKITGYVHNTLATRPYFVFWFMGQIQRAMRLWETDGTLTVALDVCKSLLPATDYLTAMWPCEEQRRRYGVLREKLFRSCLIAGVTPPDKMNLDLQRFGNEVV